MKKCSTFLAIREMSVKTRMRYHFTPTRLARIKKANNNKGWWRCGEIRTLIHCWWACKMVQLLWKTVWQFFKQLNVELPYGSVNSTPRYTPKRNENLCPLFIQNLYTNVHSSVIHNGQKIKTTQCPSTDERINKMWYIDTVEYFLAIKRNELLIYATTQMNLENMKETSHKGLHIMWLHLDEMFEIGKAIETEIRLVVS